MEEAKVRELLADVVALKNTIEVPTPAYAMVCALERKLGGMLPPITGMLNVDLTSLTS